VLQAAIVSEPTIRAAVVILRSILFSFRMVSD
jgi:hypothetical protein